jgi:hypothetical protein
MRTRVPLQRRLKSHSNLSGLADWRGARRESVTIQLACEYPEPCAHLEPQRPGSAAAGDPAKPGNCATDAVGRTQWLGPESGKQEPEHPVAKLR